MTARGLADVDRACEVAEIVLVALASSLAFEPGRDPRLDAVVDDVTSGLLAVEALCRRTGSCGRGSHAVLTERASRVATI